jgi:site-specific recombinase XerC
MCKRYLLQGQIVLGRASTAVSELLNEQERGFLLHLQELRNFGLIKRAALFNAKFGRKISVWKIQKFYKENKVHYGRPSRLFNRAISNVVQLNLLRDLFK